MVRLVLERKSNVSVLLTDAKLCISWGPSAKKEKKTEHMSERGSEGWVSCTPVLINLWKTVVAPYHYKE